MDMPVYPGDPLTPGVGATKDAKRLAIGDAQTITKIPVLPISYGDAQPLLAALAGPTAPEEWRGALALTYHVGPGPAKVHLRVKSDWSLKPLRSEEHTSELQSQSNLVCRLLLEKKKNLGKGRVYALHCVHRTDPGLLTV